MPAPTTHPPATRNHLSRFREVSRAWLVPACNAIPVIGVHAPGGSPAVAVVEIWFDGVTALAATSAAAVTEDRP